MKTIRFFLWGLMGLALAACSDNLYEGAQKRVTVSAQMPQTRTVFSEENDVTHVLWVANDAIGVYTNAQSNLPYIAAQNGTSSDFTAQDAEIDAEEGDEVFAYYPYSASASEGTIRNANQSSIQSSTAYDYMYGVSSVEEGSVALQFQHVFAFLKVSVTPSNLKNDNFTILHEGQSILARDVTVANNRVSPVQGDSEFEIPNLSDLMNQDSPVSFYIAVLPQEGGVELEFGSYDSSRTFASMFRKITPSAGLQAGYVYRVSMDSEIGSEEEIDAQRSALMAFYQATNGDNWSNNTNWGSDEPIGTWYGVKTDSNGDVVALWLDGDELSGSIPSEIGQLDKLKTLSLLKNNLSGPIPPTIGQLVNLQELSLYGNSFSGDIPSEICQLENLQILYLAANDLSGDIPSGIGKLVNLQYLDLSSNNLSGSIPSEIGQLVNLQELDLFSNNLSGSIPSEIGQLAKLGRLSLYENNLSGSLPEGIGDLSNLVSLQLYSNNLTGAIPARITSLNCWADQWSYVAYGNNFDLDDCDIPATTIAGSNKDEYSYCPDYSSNKLTAVLSFNAVTEAGKEDSFIPSMVATYNKYKNKGLDVVGILSYQSKENILSCMEKYGATWKNNNTYKAWDPIIYYVTNGTVPYVIIVDSTGRVVFQTLCQHTVFEAADFIRNYLGDPTDTNGNIDDMPVLDW